MKPVTCCPLQAAKAVLLSLLLGAWAAGFAEAESWHGFGQAAGNCAGVWRLPDTGQTVHYSTAPGDDSDHNPSVIQPSYKDNGNGTVTDNITGLMWKKCSEGQTNDAACSGTAATFPWSGLPNPTAIEQCENLIFAGFSDWRLPNIKELMSIADYGAAAAPRINAVFPNTQALSADYYWSSTYSVPQTGNIWCVGFNTGYVFNGWFSNSGFVRCVRGGL